MFFMFYTAKLNTTRNKFHPIHPCKSVSSVVKISHRSHTEITELLSVIFRRGSTASVYSVVKGGNGRGGIS